MALSHLLYVSVASETLAREELEDIRQVSEDNNRARHITGVLFYSAGQFVQLLEGEADDVRWLFDKVERDPRHHDVRLLVLHPVERRVFTEWGMGLLDLDHHGADAQRKLERLVEIAGRGEVDEHGTPIEMVILSEFCMLLPAS
ncbi:MAG: BLUF domain-containing protein [Planctomycetota bacterium]